MKRPFIKIYLSSICAVLLFFSCKDKHKDCKKHGTCPPVYYEFGLDGAKDYLVAKPGSYWIYKNSKTGDLDTHTCLSFSINTYISKGSYDYSKNVTIKYEKLYRDIGSSFNDWEIDNQSTGSFTADANDPSIYNIVLRRNASSIMDCFFYPFRSGVHGGTGSSYTSYAGMDSTYTLLGKTYHNVAKFSVDKDDIWDDQLQCIRSNNIYYWAKDVGLIKKEMKTCNSSWELIDYKIIQ